IGRDLYKTIGGPGGGAVTHRAILIRSGEINISARIDTAGRVKAGSYKDNFCVCGRELARYRVSGRAGVGAIAEAAGTIAIQGLRAVVKNKIGIFSVGDGIPWRLGR